MLSLLRSLGLQYDRWFRRSPLLTLAVANGICSVLGDSAAQFISFWNADPDQLFDLNYARLLRYLFYGINMGPISGKWNEFLERQFPPRNHRTNPSNILNEKAPSPIELMEVNSTISTNHEDSSKLPFSDVSSIYKVESSGSTLDLLTIVKMVITDQLVMAPLSLIYFICFMAFTEGSNWEVVYARIHRLFWKLLLANWQVWPIIQLINFKFTPLRLRVPFSALCGIVWTIFLSYAST